LDCEPDLESDGDVLIYILRTDPYPLSNKTIACFEASLRNPVAAFKIKLARRFAEIPGEAQRYVILSPSVIR
jgi:hypothetical protein